MPAGQAVAGLVPKISILVKVRGMPEQDISSLGAMGLGGGDFQKMIMSPPPNPQSGCLVIIVFLNFLTHIRDLDAQLVGINS